MEKRMGLWRDTGGTIDFSTTPRTQKGLVGIDSEKQLYKTKDEVHWVLLETNRSNLIQRLQITYEIKENLYDSQKEFYTDVFHGFNWDFRDDRFSLPSVGYL